jgi:hypothetical protein
MRAYVMLKKGAFAVLAIGQDAFLLKLLSV